MRKFWGLVALLWLAAAPAFAQPALWRAHDRDSEVFIFGGVHVLKPGTPWFDDDLAARFAAAERIYMEVSPADRSETQRVSLRLGLLKPPESLETRLPADLYARLARELTRLGLPDEMVLRFRPWLASTMLTLMQLSQMGYDANAGVEATLAARAGERPILALERPEDGLDILAGLEPEVEARLVAASLAEFDGLDAAMTRVVSAWLAGDLDALEGAVLLEQFAELPELRGPLITDRNRKWADTLAAEMRGRSGTVFVAVGAGHLLGPDSLVRMLSDRGIAVERLR